MPNLGPFCFRNSMRTRSMVCMWSLPARVGLWNAGR